MKLRDAIDVLKKKPQDEEVHFMVFDKEGGIVAMDIEGRDLTGLFKELAKIFPRKRPPNDQHP
jgi:hypothetical protein